MAYIGRQLTAGNYLKLDDLSSQFNGSTTQFNLTSGGQAFYPGSPFSILVSLAGIIQEPDSAYQIDQSTITFAIAPQASDDFFCIALGVALAIGVPGEGTVTGSKFAKPFNYDNGLLYLDDTNNYVGINTTSPGFDLEVGPVGASGTSLRINGEALTDTLRVGGATTFTEDLVVTGNARITGILTIGTASITLDANAGKLTGIQEIVLGEVGSANTVSITQSESGTVSFSSSDGTTANVGVGTTVSINTTGIISATTFVGNLHNTVITNYAETAVNVGTLSTTVTNNIGLSTGNVFYGNLPATAGIVTFSFTTGHTTDASSFTLYLTNAASGTPTLGWPAAVTFPGGTAPDRTTAANKTDIWTFSTFNNGTTWYGDIAMYNL